MRDVDMFEDEDLDFGDEFDESDEDGDEFESLTEMLEYAQYLLDDEDGDDLEEAFDRRAYMAPYMRNYRKTDKWKKWNAGYQARRKSARTQSLQQDARAGSTRGGKGRFQKPDVERGSRALKGFGKARGATNADAAAAWGAGEKAKQAGDAATMGSAFRKLGGALKAGKRNLRAAQAWAAGKAAQAESLELEDFDNEFEDLDEGATIIHTKRMSNADRRKARMRARTGAAKATRRKYMARASTKRHINKQHALKARIGDVGARRQVRLAAGNEYEGNLAEMRDDVEGMEEGARIVRTKRMSGALRSKARRRSHTAHAKQVRAKYLRRASTKRHMAKRDRILKMRGNRKLGRHQMLRVTSNEREGNLSEMLDRELGLVND